jgi:hypothetical protein
MFLLVDSYDQLVWIWALLMDDVLRARGHQLERNLKSHHHHNSSAQYTLVLFHTKPLPVPPDLHQTFSLTFNRQAKEQGIVKQVCRQPAMVRIRNSPLLDATCFICQ